MYQVTIRATSILVRPGAEAAKLLQPLLNMHEYEDEYQDTVNVIGYMYDEEHDTLYLHKGVDLEYLRRLLVDVEFKYNLYHPYKEMRMEYEEVIPPRDEDQEDCINFIAGIKSHASNINDSQIFLVKTTGFGKAEPYSRKIPTPTPQGFTYMGDLKVGDYVFDRTGKPTKVLAIYEQGIQLVYKITFADGRTAYCAQDHLWKINHGSFKAPIIVSTRILKNIYRSISGTPQKGNRSKYVYHSSIPVSGIVEYPHQDVPIDPWVLGCLIGNGCCRERSLTISSGDNIVPNKIASRCGFIAKKNSDFNYSYTFYHENGKVVTTNEFFEKIPMMINKYSHEKTIPDIYLHNDPETRLQLLQGLMDTDGSISYREGRWSVSYTSTSKTLLEQIKWLLWSFGWSGCITVDGREGKYKKGYCGVLVFRLPNTQKHKLFSCGKKKMLSEQAKDQPQKDWYSNLIIKHIGLSHSDNCRCIVVDNPEHLYLTEDFIVTHNTYCTGHGIGDFGVKSLIVVHRDNLRTQWLKSLYDMNGFTSRDVHEITSTEELEMIANGQLTYDYDVYLMTHATFRAGCKRINDIEKIGNITKNLFIGFKVIDEAHLEFRDTLLMDFLFNVKRNLYLTATDGRSSRDENAIFKHVFANTTYYKKAILTDGMKHPDKWVDYITVDINTHVNPNVYRYRVNGGRGMSAITYGKWVIQRDKKQTHFKVCRDIIRMIYENEPSAKVLVFMPLIDLCTDCAYFLSMQLNNDESFDYSLNIKTVNSHNSKQENQTNIHADVIVTTIQSLGTGSDIKGITDIICCSPLVSRIVAQQVLGRIRYINKPCHYYDIVDMSVPADIYWWKSRSRTFKRLTKKYDHISWKEDETTNDTKEIHS